MRIRELMQSELWETFPEECLADAAARMRDHGIGSLPVLDGDELVGILTDRDLTRAVADGAPAHVTAVSRYMTGSPVVVRPDDDAVLAARLMVEYDVRHLPVAEGSKVIGMVSARDLLVLEGWPLEPAGPR